MTRGGARKGAGRPAGQGRYGEPTVPLRVPVSLRDKVSKALMKGTYRLPLYGNRVAAGFPSPADDFVEARLDANDLVIDNPSATFFLRVTGDSMCDAGIYAGDYIVVDRSRKPRHGSIVVAAVDGEFTVKKLGGRKNRPVLKAANPNYPDIVLDGEQQLRIFGVVCGLVRRIED